MSELNIGVWTLEKITPERAAIDLEARAANRNMSEKTASRYARDMINGKWRLTHQGIAYHDGRLTDGQTRLRAIVKSGIAVAFWVYRTTGDSSLIRDFDRGRPRSDAHVAQICGVSANRSEIAVARVLDRGMADMTSPVTYTPDELIAVIERHADTLAWLNQCRAFNVVCSVRSPIIGAIGRAMAIYGKEMLSRFVLVVLDGIPSGEHESAAMRLRETMMTFEGQSRSDRLDMYLRTANAIMSFAAGKTVKLLRPLSTEKEPFPGNCEA